MNGRLLLHCFAGCSYDRIVVALGLTRNCLRIGGNSWRPTATAMRPGSKSRQKIRYAPKDFRIRHQDPAGNGL